MKKGKAFIKETAYHHYKKAIRFCKSFPNLFKEDSINSEIVISKKEENIHNENSSDLSDIVNTFWI